MKSGEKIRVGIIGAGGNTKLKHIPGLQVIDGVSVEVVCNRSLGSSQLVADSFSIPRVAERWEDVVADDSLDAICIGTWPYLHAPITIAALKSGKHVLTEARMAMNAAEAEAMLEVSRENPHLVAQIVPAPFTLKWDATITEIIDAGELGDLREMNVIKTLPLNANAEEPLNWRQSIEYSGNNTLMLGIYYEVALRWLKRHPSRVWAHGSIFTKERIDPESGSQSLVRIPETLTFMADYDDGLQLSGFMSGVVLGRGHDSYTLSGTKGTLRLDLNEGTLYLARLGESEKILEPKPEAIGQWNVEADFIESVRQASPVTLTSFEDGLSYMRFTDAVKASFDASGKWVDL